MQQRWKIFKVICLLQTAGTSLLVLTALFYFFQRFSFGNFIHVVLFGLALALALLGLHLLRENYPAQPVTGKQKTAFNWLYLFNFLFLAFFFAIIFSELKLLRVLAESNHISFFDLPASALFFIICYPVLLIFQLYILYGLFTLRRELYTNFRKQEFEFEQ